MECTPNLLYTLLGCVYLKIMDTITIILCLLFAIVDPLCYVIARNNGLPEAKGWKKIIPFCWVFA